jgi:DNA-3-methyladenine glycosylase
LTPSLLSRPPLPRSFYAADPLHVARALLGALVVHHHPERGVLAGRVVETEAYRGEEDLACHASAGRTRRAETLFGPPGYAYVYLIYGMYHMLNAVTWPEDHPSAVLIRALEPVEGIDRATDGPGKLTRALAIDLSHNRADLVGRELFFTPDRALADADVAVGPRIGVDYAGEWAERPWRFYVRDSPWVSRARPGGPRMSSKLSSGKELCPK